MQHTAVSEAALTAWMKVTLAVSWIEHPHPSAVERAVIGLLAPPLNWQYNKAHPNWPALDLARRAWREARDQR